MQSLQRGWLLARNAAAYWFGNVDTGAIIAPADELELEGLGTVNRRVTCLDS